MSLRAVLGPFAMLLLASALLSAQDERPESAPPDDTALPVPAYLDGRYLGEIGAYPDDTGAVLLVPSEVIGLVDDVLIDRVTDDARTLFPRDRPVPPDAFSTLGLTVVFDWDDLLVRIEVPPLLQRPVQVSLSGRRRGTRGEPVRPVPFSLIVNLGLLGQVTYETPRVSFAATPELAASVYGVAIETQTVLRTGEQPLTLDYARASWDIPGLGYRVQGGDLTWRATELLGVPRITGVALFRERATTTPTTAGSDVITSIFQPVTGSIGVIVNESERYLREHPPGNYEIADLPLGDGVNTVIVTWEDEDGPRIAEIVIPYDGDLLDEGELDAGIAAGIADRDVGRPLVATYGRYGLTRTVSLGVRAGVEIVNFQVDAGMDAMLASRIGTFRFEPTVGIGPGDRTLVDLPLRYSYLDSRPTSYLSFGLGGGYRTVTAPSTATASQLITANAYVNLVLPDGFSITPTASALVSLSERTSRYSLRASLRKSIRGGSALSANVGLDYDEALSFVATITYSAAFPAARQNLFVQQNLNTQELFAFWNRYPGDDPHAFDFNASASVPIDTAEVLNLNGQVGYAQRRFEATLGHDLAGVVATGDLRNTTSVGLRSALTVAGGLVGVSRPVPDSFALVTTGGALADTPVTVRRGGDESGPWVPGTTVVLNGLNAHAPVEVTVEPTELVRGLEERELRFVLEPTYRSGTVIRVEPARTVYAGGVLLDRSATPIPFRLGIWTGPGETTGEFFTDDEGYFEAYGLAPGVYELEIPGRPGISFRIEIPGDAPEYVDLGEVEPEEAPE